MSSFEGYGTNAGTLTGFILLGIVWVVKNKCKHSSCEVDTGCLKCQADDKNTIRNQPDLEKGLGSEQEAIKEV